MKNIKKLITSITLGLLVVAGIGTTVKVANAASDQMNISDKDSFVIEMFDNDFSKALAMTPAEWTQHLMDKGIISKDEGKIELDYYNSTDDAEKQRLYEKLVDLKLSKRHITGEEAKYLKGLRHDDKSESFDMELMFE